MLTDSGLLEGGAVTGLVPTKRHEVLTQRQRRIPEDVNINKTDVVTSSHTYEHTTSCSTRKMRYKRLCHA